MKSRKEALRIAKKIFAGCLKDGQLDESAVRTVGTISTCTGREPSW